MTGTGWTLHGPDGTVIALTDVQMTTRQEVVRPSIPDCEVPNARPYPTLYRSMTVLTAAVSGTVAEWEE